MTNKQTVEKQSSSLDSSSNSTREEQETNKQFTGNLSITALYTSAVWHWAQFSGAHFFNSEDARRVFSVTNLALAVMRVFRWSLPHLPEGLAQRHTLIEQLASENDTELMIEFASGLSMRGWRTLTMSQVNRRLKRYIEIDLPHVLEHKRQALTQKNELPLGLSFFHKDLKELGLEELEQLVADTSKPTFIAEGLVMYLSPEELRVFFGLLAQLLVKQGGRLIFDWVPTIEQPKPGLFGRVLAALMRRFTGGDSFQRDQRSRDDMKTLLLDLGATSVTLYDCHLYAEERHLPFPAVHTQQLVFCADFTVL